MFYVFFRKIHSSPDTRFAKILIKEVHQSPTTEKIIKIPIIQRTVINHSLLYYNLISSYIYIHYDSKISKSLINKFIE